MPGKMSDTYKGPRDNNPHVPTWMRGHPECPDCEGTGMKLARGYGPLVPCTRCGL